VDAGVFAVGFEEGLVFWGVDVEGVDELDVAGFAGVDAAAEYGVAGEVVGLDFEGFEYGVD
jgi:hypothetical protein